MARACVHARSLRSTAEVIDGRSASSFALILFFVRLRLQAIPEGPVHHLFYLV